jgi:hypothetical protein
MSGFLLKSGLAGRKAAPGALNSSGHHTNLAGVWEEVYPDTLLAVL